MLTNRERFWRTMRFQPVDRLPFWADWLGPVEQWRQQGMPGAGNIADDGDVRAWFVDLFGFEGMYSAFWGTSRVPVNIGVCPGLASETLEETGAYRIYRNGTGVVVKQFKHIPGSLHPTQFLSYPIQHRRDWERFRDRHLDPDAPGRYPEEAAWQEMVRGWKGREDILTIDGGSFYGFLRDWIGVERLSVLFYDDPGLIHEMIDYLAGFYIQILHKALHEVDVDCATFWDEGFWDPSFWDPSFWEDCTVPVTTGEVIHRTYDRYRTQALQEDEEVLILLQSIIRVIRCH